ncbi:MAG: hypothetical protein FK734_12445 [Asgard group archaeon]|nr:hypothetical protein [Asgard group archaeon]
MNLENTKRDLRTANSIDSSGSQTSDGLVISIILAIIASGLLTLLIIMIPEYPFSSINPEVNTIYDNFFYDIRYYNYSTYIYGRIFPSIGYYIIMPPTLILFIISGTGLLIKDQKQTKRLIFTNWVLYLVPMITGIVQYYLGQESYSNHSYYWREIAQPLGFYPLYLNLIIQTLLLIDGNNFRGWTGFDLKNNQSNKFISKQVRIALTILFILFYLPVASVPILWIAAAFDNNTMFMVMWSCVGPYLGLFIFALFPVYISRSPKKKIMQLVSQGEFSIPAIAYNLKLKEINVQTIIKEKIASGEIFGNLSVDGLNILVKDPKLLFTSEKEEDVSSRVEDLMEPKNEIGFWISIGLTIISVGVFTLLIVMVPILEVRTITPAELSGDNYFYSWEYNPYSGATYQLSNIEPSSGFYIFAPIGAITLLISGFGLPVSDKNQLRKLILINCGLYIIPIIATVYITTQILGSSYTYGTYVHPRYITRGLEYGSFLSLFYFTPYIFIQGSMFNEKTTFLEWSGFTRKRDGMKQTLKVGRIINTIFFLLIFLWMWFYVFALMIFDNRYSLMMTHLSLLIALFVWWFFGEISRLNTQNTKQTKIITGITKMNITDLQGLSSRINIPLEQIQTIVYNKSKRNPSLGSLSADGLSIIPWNRNDKLICKKCDFLNESDSKYCSNCGLKFDEELEALKIENSTKDLENKQLIRIPKRKLFGILSFVIAIIAMVCYIFILTSWVKTFFLLFIILILLYAGIVFGISSSQSAYGIIGYVVNSLSTITVVICIFLIIANIA